MSDPKRFLSTREVAQFLDVNEKMVYTLVAEKGLPGTKVTGKWRFPLDFVEKWLESHMVNPPREDEGRFPDGLLVLAGSNDILLERAASLFSRENPGMAVALATLGSLSGIRALARGQCHAAPSHLIQEDGQEYNFEAAFAEIPGDAPVVVNFCRREQGLVVAKGNPLGLCAVADLVPAKARIANRSKGTGTRLLLDRELEKAGHPAKKLPGYDREFRGHLDAALEVLSGRADAALAIRPAAHLLGLSFISFTWERFDLVTLKSRFFDRPFQLFLALLKTPAFADLAKSLPGYDLSLMGRVVYPHEGRGE
ncbi:MAG: helix-turn-helix transcriptional regulator [Proteobacteria bacterium]|nr:helix-turn-helix transcriptional regulator [Pseudomonadota bacterium]